MTPICHLYQIIDRAVAQSLIPSHSPLMMIKIIMKSTGRRWTTMTILRFHIIRRPIEGPPPGYQQKTQPDLDVPLVDQQQSTRQGLDVPLDQPKSQPDLDVSLDQQWKTHPDLGIPPHQHPISDETRINHHIQTDPKVETATFYPLALFRHVAAVPTYRQQGHHVAVAIYHPHGDAPVPTRPHRQHAQHLADDVILLTAIYRLIVLDRQGHQQHQHEQHPQHVQHLANDVILPTAMCRLIALDRQGHPRAVQPLCGRLHQCLPRGRYRLVTIVLLYHQFEPASHRPKTSICLPRDQLVQLEREIYHQRGQSRFGLQMPLLFPNVPKPMVTLSN
mmetsp:Transcript_38151/g.92327  ORF Transcript_38151/g.92327 Transcript_38151/m.92327 type:complete len:333 (-) Transcript_38151:230-1228(-)